MSDNVPQVELPRYKSHKIVHALKIRRIEPNDGTGGATLHWYLDAIYGPLEVDNLFMAKHNPSAGGYYVIYPDGYQSWSPAQAFEEGYSLIEEIS
jgi:hypothetical protein